ncbi:MAG: DUF4395 family protein [Bacteroidales bacterium]
MIRFRQLVCPVSSEHVDENIVRATALLVMFAFMECVLNFCAGCWIFTYVVVPLTKRN